MDQILTVVTTDIQNGTLRIITNSLSDNSEVNIKLLEFIVFKIVIE